MTLSTLAAYHTYEHLHIQVCSTQTTSESQKATRIRTDDALTALPLMHKAFALRMHLPARAELVERAPP